jgi:arylsulfatase A-like enzyme
MFMMKPIYPARPGRKLVCGLLAVMLLEFLPAARAQFVLTNNSPRPLPRRPSIILIVADGLGYGDLSSYGQTKFQTPNLDRLAAGGVRCTSYYAGGTVGSPARAALLLGRDPEHLQQRADEEVPLAADDITVAKTLKQSGYHTGLIGGWELGNDNTSGAPWNQGFDEFAGYFNPGAAENVYADYMWRYDPAAHFQGKTGVYENAGGKNGQYIPDLFTTMSANFIANNQPDRFNHFRPFFLVLNYTIPGAGNGRVPTDAPFSEEPWPQLEKNRAAMITRLDANIGQLLDQLKQRQMESNTVIFFTSNSGLQTNGGFNPKFLQSAGPFRGGGGDPYEGSLRVPMIVRWPGRIPAGQVSDFTWAAWDFLPTATAIALIEPPAGTDGISILPALLGQTQTNRHEFFHWQLQGRNVWHTVRMGDWEAVQPKTGDPLELYNLKTDPGETHNVADQNPDLITRFQGILKSSR